jgi:TRAP-type C4-dicarboxylate transport system permease small subunit
MVQFGRLLWKGLVIAQKWFMIIAGTIVAVLVLVEVILRYVFGSPLFGVEEMVCLIAVWLYFIGAAYGAFERSHIKAELIHVWIKSPRKLAFIKAVAALITLGLACVMVSWSYPYLLWGIKRGETSQALLLPMVYSQSAIFVGSVLMCLYFLTELIDHILTFLGKNPVFEGIVETETDPLAGLE